MHAHVRIGDADLMFNDHFPEMGAPPIAQGNWPITLHLYVPDVDAVFARAVAAGATATMPVADQFWGDRYGLIKDPAGFSWGIADSHRGSHAGRDSGKTGEDGRWALIKLTS